MICLVCFIISLARAVISSGCRSCVSAVAISWPSPARRSIPATRSQFSMVRPSCAATSRTLASSLGEKACSMALPPPLLAPEGALRSRSSSTPMSEPSLFRRGATSVLVCTASPPGPITPGGKFPTVLEAAQSPTAPSPTGVHSVTSSLLSRGSVEKELAHARRLFGPKRWIREILASLTAAAAFCPTDTASASERIDDSP
mmetsp:Transcript_27588/g.63530  ORF Transcript_27588/g.63530 Transcript_27588/m.63530 type:complete len:201 (-) Transcript_27588:171-773(-)